MIFIQVPSIIPSIKSSKWVTLFINFVVRAINSISNLRSLSSTKEHSFSMTGNRMAFPGGMLHLRVADPPKVPAKNHTDPFWFCAQFLPVVSMAGLDSIGCSRSHLTHRTHQSEYNKPYGLESTENTLG